MLLIPFIIISCNSDDNNDSNSEELIVGVW